MYREEAMRVNRAMMAAAAHGPIVVVVKRCGEEAAIASPFTIAMSVLQFC